MTKDQIDTMTVDKDTTNAGPEVWWVSGLPDGWNAHLEKAESASLTKPWGVTLNQDTEIKLIAEPIYATREEAFEKLKEYLRALNRIA